MKISPRSKTLDLEYQRLRRLWYQLWHSWPSKKQMAILIFSPDWPDDFRDVIVRLRFLQKAIQEAYNFAKYNDKPPAFPGSWIHAGLFRGSKWLWERTWTSLESSADLYDYEQSPEAIPTKLKNLLRQMLD